MVTIEHQVYFNKELITYESSSIPLISKIEKETRKKKKHIHPIGNQYNSASISTQEISLKVPYIKRNVTLVLKLKKDGTNTAVLSDKGITPFQYFANLLRHYIYF